MTASWGPKNGIDSKDYILYMEGKGGPTDTPVSLLGHSLTSPNQNLTDPLVYTQVQLVNGRVVTVSRVKRAATETSRTYTIGFPSALWTPAMERSVSQGCETTFYLIYTCPEDDIYNHWDILPEGVLSPAIEAEDVITTSDDTNILTQTSELSIPHKIRGWALGYASKYDAAGTVAYNDVVFLTQDCIDCNDSLGYGMIAVGGDAVAAPSVTETDDRFATINALDIGAAIGDVAYAVYASGPVILVSVGDNADPGTATTASVYLSTDTGANWVAVAGLPDVIHTFFEADQTIFAVGATVAGAGAIWFSNDRGKNWTEVVSAALPVAAAITSGDYDTDTQKVYFAGESGILLTGRLSGDSISLTDISANLSGAPGDLFGLKVLAKGTLVVVGAAGYVSESIDSGVTFAAVSFPGSVALTGVDGNVLRLVVCGGSGIYERNAMTDNDFVLVTLDNGEVVTGTYSSVRMNHEDFNRFVAVTSDGEVIMGLPNYPDA